jgi:hypothetical protein
MQRNVDRCIHWVLGYRPEPIAPDRSLTDPALEYQEPVIKPSPENE